ncbi:MAG: HAD family hydrolase [Pirellulales bacterium]
MNDVTDERWGVIFDLDGTLARTNLDFDGIRTELGLPPGVPILEAIERMSADAASQAWEVLDRHEGVAAADAEPMPGAVEFVNSLRERDWPVAILTRNSRRAALATLERLGLQLDVLRGELVAREDGPIKPDPAAVWRICRNWGLPPERTLLVGDHWFDLETARRAGVRGVLYTGSHERGRFGHDWHADFVLTSFADADALLAWLAEST